MIIEIGATAEPLHIQLGLPEDATFQLQRDHDAINRLAARGYLSEGTKESLHLKLIKNLQTTLNDKPE